MIDKSAVEVGFFEMSSYEPQVIQITIIMKMKEYSIMLILKVISASLEAVVKSFYILITNFPERYKRNHISFSLFLTFIPFCTSTLSWIQTICG